MSVNILSWLCAVVLCCQAAKLPDYYKKCKLEDPNLPQCIANNINDGMPSFTKGSYTYRVPTFYPLHVPYLKLDINGGLNIDAMHTNITGVENFRVSKVDFDLKRGYMELSTHTPIINLAGEYKISGRILILPINGEGEMNITFVEPDVKYVFDFNLIERNNKQYIQPKNMTFIYVAKRVYYYLANLFNGDQRLGEQMNKFLNENWKEVDQEIGAHIGQALGEIIHSVIKNFFSRVPYDELFD